MRVSPEQVSSLAAAYVRSVMERALREVTPEAPEEVFSRCFEAAVSTCWRWVFVDGISERRIARITSGFARHWLRENAPEIPTTPEESE